MKKSIHKIYSRVGIESNRTKNITKHVFLSVLYKGGSIVCNFLLVPLTINYLDTQNYGIWLTLSSFIAWFSFFDIGLGNGLRNKFAEAKAKGDMTLARGYVSSAYYTIGFVSFSLTLCFIILNLFVDWTNFFNVSKSLQKDLSVLMPIVFGFFCLQLVVKLISTIYTADQRHSMEGKINFFTQSGSLFLIWMMTKTSESSLLIFGIIFSAFPVILLLSLNLIAFNNRYKSYKPSFRLWKKDYLKDIFGLGVKFFIIQVSGIILFSTDNIIITQLFGPKEVVPYNIAFKYFSIVNMILSLTLTPFWSAVTEAYTNRDFEWIKKSMKNVLRITFLSNFIIVILIILSHFFYKLWIGNKVVIPMKLTVFMAIYFCLTNFYAPFTYFINGTGKVKLQMYSVLTTSLFNIPLSIYFARNLDMGVSGVILATIVCLVPHVLISPIQYLKIIKNKANGIWSE